MKRHSTNTTQTISKYGALILLGTLAAAMSTVACSKDSKPSNSTAQPSATVRPVAMETVVPATVQAAVPVAKTTAATKPTSKFIAYKSRDYGVSFLYPWQYAYVNARTIAASDGTLLPQSDGHDGQFTLARVEIPKGFYPDTDFESAYFTLSLNQDLGEQECESTLNLGKDGKVQTTIINGIDFRWMETETGGRGETAKFRNYVAFTNDACYELEMAVKTGNDGLAREIDPNQVLRRLDAVLQTVKIAPSTKAPLPAQLESSADVPQIKTEN